MLVVGFTRECGTQDEDDSENITVECLMAFDVIRECCNVELLKGDTNVVMATI